MIGNPDRVRQCVDQALRIAKAERCVTCVIFPNDVQEMTGVSSPPRKHGATFSVIGYEMPMVIPNDPEIKKRQILSFN